MLFVEPVPRHLLNQDYHDENIPHFIIKKNYKDFKKENKVMFDMQGKLTYKLNKQ